MKLLHLSDINLLKETKVLVSKEREILSKVLWHLKEIDIRKLYSKEKCASLFEYCVKILKYSEAQASRRVTACRMLREMPELANKIEKGSINLTQLNQARSFFNEENIIDNKNKMEIINLIEGTSTRESESILWKLKSPEASQKQKIIISDNSYQKLKALQALKAHSCKNLDELIDKMYEELNTLWNPMLNPTFSSRTTKNENKRYISKSDKSTIWERDKGKCQNCGSTYAIQIDHIQPFSHGGKTNLGNLRLLCRNCNQSKGTNTFELHSSRFS
jgi:hypothetical protein